MDPKKIFDDYVSYLRDDIKELREELEPYKAGTLHVGFRSPDEVVWHDATPGMIADLEREISSREERLAVVLARGEP